MKSLTQAVTDVMTGVKSDDEKGAMTLRETVARTITGTMPINEANTSQVYKAMKALPDASWNTMMSDIQNALPSKHMIPTAELDKYLSKMVGRK